MITNALQKVNVEEETVFTNGIPLIFFSAVSNGIHEFHEKKKKKRTN